MHEHDVSGRPVQGRRAGERREAPRRRTSGPRPVRPAVSPVGVRPAEAERPQMQMQMQRSGPGRRPPLRAPSARTLVRRPPAAEAPAGVGVRLRRLLAGLATTVITAAVVVGLGLLADAAAGMRADGPGSAGSPAPVVVTVETERTPRDVARRVAPGASGSELAALAERIVTENSLGPVPLRPGQVLRVTSG